MRVQIINETGQLEHTRVIDFDTGQDVPDVTMDLVPMPGGSSVVLVRVIMPAAALGIVVPALRVAVEDASVPEAGEDMPAMPGSEETLF